MQYIDIEEIAQQSRDISGFIDFLTTDHQFVWATNQNTLQKFCFDRFSPIYQAAVPTAAGIPIFAFDSIWVASLSTQSIYRIDADSGQILSVIATGLADLSGEFSLAADPNGVWVACANGLICQIDPRTNTITQNIEVLAESYNLCYAFNSLWLTNPKQNSVQRINPFTKQVSHCIRVDQQPWFLCASKQAIWTLNQTYGTVSQIDPHSNLCIKTIQLPPLARGDGGDIHASHGKIWIRSTHIPLIEIDEHSGEILRVFQYGQAAGSGAICSCDHRLWITAHDIDKLWIIPIN